MPPRTQPPRYTFTVAACFRGIGLAAAATTLLFTAASIATYVPDHPEFSFLRTYLSDLGATPGAPGILFNAGMLLVAPLRLLLVVLLALRFLELGVPRSAALATAVVGAIASAGVILMTAAPYTVSRAAHELGIMLFFLGTVVVQSLITLLEWRLRALPRLLPLTSALVVVSYVVFAVLLGLFEAGEVPRSVPVLPEWLCFATSLVWLGAHALRLDGGPRTA